MIRELNQTEMKNTVGGAGATLSLGALGTVEVNAAIPALAALVAGLNDILMGSTGLLGGFI